MSFFREWGRFMMAGAAAHARWEMNVSNTILHDRKRLLLLALITVPVVLGIVASYAYADDVGSMLPDMLGGKEAYTPALYSTGIFVAAIFVGLIAGLITGCIGAGGGFIITPALMSFGVKGILAVGTDLFHIFAKAIMGSVIHRKLGNVAVGLAVFFVAGSLIGATVGGMINRALYDSNPILSDAFITSIYSVMLGVLGFYALTDYLKSRRSGGGSAHGGEGESEALGGVPKRMQSIKIPPMIKFDHNVTPGGRRISWVFVSLTGALVGFTASIMGVGGGFLTFPVFVYTLGVSSTTTVGTDIFQIIFTGGYSAIAQYAIYGFIFYTLAIGMLLGSLVGIQLGSLVTRVVPGTHIRGFYAMAVLAGFANRIFALPGKLGDLDVLPISGHAGDVLENIGIFVFFIVLGTFALWVIGTFLRNLKKLRRVEVEI
jgi:uncharacterized membrane protein YfcA